MKRFAYAVALVLSGVSSVALAANVPLAIRNEIHHCGCVGCCAQANNQPPPFTPRSTDYTGTTFAYDISDGRWWVAADSFLIPAAINLTNFCDKRQFVVVSLGANSFHLVGIVHQNTLSFDLGCLFYDTRRRCAT